MRDSRVVVYHGTRGDRCPDKQCVKLVPIYQINKRYA